MKMFAVAVHDARASLCMKQQLPARPSFRDNAELARQRGWWGRYGRRDLLKWPRVATAVNYRRECAFSFSNLTFLLLLLLLFHLLILLLLHLFPFVFSSFFHFSAQLLRHDLPLYDAQYRIQGRVLWNYSFHFDVAAHNALIRG